MQGKHGGKLGMPKATDKAKNLRLPALQEHDIEVLCCEINSKPSTQKRVRGQIQAVHDSQTSVYVVHSILKTLTTFSMNRHN